MTTVYTSDLTLQPYQNQFLMWNSTNGRKAWQSSYDPKFIEPSARSRRYVLPDVSSLPEGRWVTLRTENLPEDFKSEKDTIRPWARSLRIKYHLTWVMLNYRETQVFVFKKAKHAVLFKLAWG